MLHDVNQKLVFVFCPVILARMFNDLIFDQRRLGFAIKSTRDRLGLSLRSVSKASGVSPSQILRIESGEFDCTVSTLVKLCGALAIQYGALCEYCIHIDSHQYSNAALHEENSPFQKYRDKVTKIEQEAYLNLIAESAATFVYILKSNNPVAIIRSIDFPVTSQKSLFETFAKKHSEKGLFLEDRYDVLTTLQRMPAIWLVKMGLVNEEIIVLFCRWYKAASRKNQTPWIAMSNLCQVQIETVIM